MRACAFALAATQAGVALGPAVLFFGCRSSAHDFIYKSQLQAWLSAGILTDLQVALSREPGQPRVYVQDLVKASGPQIWQLLQQGAHVYVCGDAKRMAPDVRAAFEGLVQTAGGLGGAEAVEWVHSMREQAKYLEDVWAS